MSLSLPPNWSIVECSQCGDPVFAERGVIRLHAGVDSRRQCPGTGWMIQPNTPVWPDWNPVIESLRELF